LLRKQVKRNGEEETMPKFLEGLTVREIEYAVAEELITPEYGEWLVDRLIAPLDF
jgi:hypothetical protein